jgi:chromosomal replication initiator protein
MCFTRPAKIAIIHTGLLTASGYAGFSYIIYFFEFTATTLLGLNPYPDARSVMPGSQPLTFAQFVAVPENRPALLAVRQVVDCLAARRTINPLYLHGVPGTGKTHLVSALIEEAIRRIPDLVASSISAAELGRPASPPEDGNGEEAPAQPDARQLDLFVVEDLQFLPGRAAETFRQRFDELRSRQVQMVFTASVGPCELALPARLCSRLGSGLVVRLEPLGKSSRLAVLEDKAQRRQLAIHRETLAWLAEHLTGGGRSLDGALAKLEVLARSQPQPLELAAVKRHFEEQAEAARPTMERIVQRVGGHFRVEPKQLQSSRRGREVLLPRQVSMYLARQLTGLSLEQIGAYFGGRDHSTVLHACRKMEQALSRDPVLSGTIRRLRSDLA